MSPDTRSDMPRSGRGLKWCVSACVCVCHDTREVFSFCVFLPLFVSACISCFGVFWNLERRIGPVVS